MAGDDHHLGIGQLFPRLAQDGQAVHVLHAQVGENDIELFLLDLGRAGLAAGGNDTVVTDAPQAFRDGLGVHWFVVDD